MLATMMRDPIINRAIAAMNQPTGGLTKLADELGITAQALSQWKRIPSHQVLRVEAVTGIHRTLLRPDLYPPEPAAAQ